MSSACGAQAALHSSVSPPARCDKQTLQLISINPSFYLRGAIVELKSIV